VSGGYHALGSFDNGEFGISGSISTPSTLLGFDFGLNMISRPHDIAGSSTVPAAQETSSKAAVQKVQPRSGSSQSPSPIKKQLVSNLQMQSELQAAARSSSSSSSLFERQSGLLDSKVVSSSSSSCAKKEEVILLDKNVMVKVWILLETKGS
jgi:hypothetical protein